MATTLFYYSVVFHAVPKYIYPTIIDELNIGVGGPRDVSGQFYVREKNCVHRTANLGHIRTE